MTELNLERFARILDFLETPEELGGVPKRDFDMNAVVRGDPRKLGHNCGSRACVVGYFPIIFPEAFHYCGKGLVGIANKKNGREVFLDLREFLGCDGVGIFSCRISNNNPLAVARDIRKFLAEKIGPLK